MASAPADKKPAPKVGPLLSALIGKLCFFALFSLRFHKGNASCFFKHVFQSQ